MLTSSERVSFLFKTAVEIGGLNHCIGSFNEFNLQTTIPKGLDSII